VHGEDRGLRRVTTNRSGGVSGEPFDGNNLASHVGDDPAAVAENRRRLAAHLGLPADRLVVLQAISGGDAEYVTDARVGEREGVEGLVTTTAGLGLAVIAADCVPVTMTDLDAGVLAVAHAGRRGMATDIVTRTLRLMASHGARPTAVTAWLGPAICGGCYEVGEVVQDEVATVVPAARCLTRDGTPGLDLHAGVRSQLVDAGVRDIRADPRCTLEHDDLYSYRRDGVTGRHGVAVALVPS
jgi:YfiH family protein